MCQTIRVAHAHEQADDGRWRLDTGAQRVDRQKRRHDVAEIGTSTHLPVLDEPHEREAVGHE
ncbi:MAG TPA: hypothetical protein VID48_09955, partial [Solirubrobacteraceae bacterium]